MIFIKIHINEIITTFFYIRLFLYCFCLPDNSPWKCEDAHPKILQL